MGRPRQDISIYQDMMQAQVQQDAALQQAIARVAAAFAGGSGQSQDSLQLRSVD